MAKAKVKACKYVVTQPHTIGLPVGAVVELTAEKAAFLVNKVRPLDEIEAERKGNAPGAAAQKRIDALTVERDALLALATELEQAAAVDKSLGAHIDAAQERIAVRSKAEG